MVAAAKVRLTPRTDIFAYVTVPGVLPSLTRTVRGAIGQCAVFGRGSPDQAGHTGSMTTSTSTQPARSGPEIRAALARHAPAEVAVFEDEFRRALKEAAVSFDTRVVDDVVERWWRMAIVRSIEFSDEEQDQIRRAQAGDYMGLLEQTADGSFRRIG